MLWFLIIYMGNVHRFGGAATTVGPFQTQAECMAVERQVQSHYSGSYWTNTDCVSGARK